MSRPQVAVRRAGALVALAAASVLVLLLVPGAVAGEDEVLALYATFQIACAAVLLSPASRAVADLARLAARVMFAAPAVELWTALRVPLHLLAGPRATWQTEAAMRRTGALLALAAASVLVPLLGPGAAGSEDEVLVVYAVFLFGSAAVLLSPANRAVAEPARLPEKTWLRWAGFTCISFCAAAGVRAAQKVSGLLLFLLLVGVWGVSLSMIAARERGPQPLPLLQPVPPPPPAEEGRDGGAVVNVTVTPHKKTTSVGG